LNFALVDQKLHPSLDDPFVLQRAYFIEPLLTFSKRLRPYARNIRSRSTTTCGCN
jgi:hypothetical protein